MAVSLAISGIFIVKEWPDLEIWVWGRSPSFKIERCDRSCTTFYWYSDLLLVENREIFIPHQYLAPPEGVIPSEFREAV